MIMITYIYTDSLQYQLTVLPYIKINIKYFQKDHVFRLIMYGAFTID